MQEKLAFTSGDDGVKIIIITLELCFRAFCDNIVI
jgi:hypothetical protein